MKDFSMIPCDKTLMPSAANLSMSSDQDSKEIRGADVRIHVTELYSRLMLNPCLPYLNYFLNLYFATKTPVSGKLDILCTI